MQSAETKNEINGLDSDYFAIRKELREQIENNSILRGIKCRHKY
jgi:hypothetical protein